MTCRCANPQEHARRAEQNAADSIRSDREMADREKAEAKRATDARFAELAARTPNPDQFEVDRIQEVGKCLVMRVIYPSCSKCAYEGAKVMVFEGPAVIDVIKWRRIDPHFRDPGALAGVKATKEAPSPIARFPGSEEGWKMAVFFAGIKDRPISRGIDAGGLRYPKEG